MSKKLRKLKTSERKNELELKVKELFEQGAFDSEPQPNFRDEEDPYKAMEKNAYSIKVLNIMFGQEAVQEQVDKQKYSKCGKLGEKIIEAKKALRSILMEANDLALKEPNELTLDDMTFANNISEDMKGFADSFSTAGRNIKDTIETDVVHADNLKEYAQDKKDIDACISLLEGKGYSVWHEGAYVWVTHPVIIGDSLFIFGGDNTANSIARAQELPKVNKRTRIINMMPECKTTNVIDNGANASKVSNGDK